MSLLLKAGQPPFKIILSLGVQGLLSAPAFIAKICKLPVIPDMVMPTEDWAALNLNQAELFWAAFQLQEVVFGLYISPGWLVKPLLDATIISAEPKQ